MMITDSVNLRQRRNAADLKVGQYRGKRDFAPVNAGLYLVVFRGILVALLLPFFSTAAIAWDTQSVSQQPISAIPLSTDIDQRKVALGRRLFNDSRLSGDNDVSCSSCHILSQGLTDGIPISRGRAGYPGVTNTLSLFNVGLNSKYSWNGSVVSLQERTDQVVESKNTMGAKWDAVLATLSGDKAMTDAFSEIYTDGLMRNNVVDALVAFEKSLNTPNAPFDRYLRGDAAAINDGAKAGYQLFKNYGCASCHQGVNVGGNMLQIFGIFGNSDAAAQGAKTPGSAQNTGISDNLPVFRVPSLRNVAHTGPYFHDGSVKTLHDAIVIMAKNQLGRSIDDDDAARLEDFLKSLTGEYQGVSLDRM
ncbi:cytochrome-c peroxidase [Rhizobium ruizarguesonis]